MDFTIGILKILSWIMVILGGSSWIWEYRLKVRAERRLAEAGEIESQVKLLNLFTEIMNIAHARGGYQLSDAVLNKVLTPEVLKKSGLRSPEFNDLITSALIHIPVGVAAQDAAIVAIWKLGTEHKILKEISIQALESLCDFKENIARPYLEDIKK